MHSAAVLEKSMKQDIREMYRAAIERMDVSDDADIESLRRANVKALARHESAGPELIAHGAGKTLEWGEYAFGELRSTGFIVNDWSKIMWFRPSKAELDDAANNLAGLEAAAIVRLGSMRCKAVMSNLNEYLDSFLTHASNGAQTEASLAHQRLMFLVVAATGQERLMEEYGKKAKVALAYALAERLNNEKLQVMRRSARKMIELIGSSAPRDCAAHAVAMRVHPGQTVNA